jgi:hypothetical protein
MDPSWEELWVPTTIDEVYLPAKSIYALCLLFLNLLLDPQICDQYAILEQQHQYLSE